MNLIEFQNINFENAIDKTNKVISACGEEIQIVQYLPVHDKYDLIMATLKRAYEHGMYSPLKLDMYFDLNLVSMYTNIFLTDEVREDEAEAYDKLKRSGVLDLVKENIPKEELAYLYEIMEKTLAAHEAYNSSITNMISNLLTNFTDKLGKGMEALKNINPEMLTTILQSNPELVKLISNQK